MTTLAEALAGARRVLRAAGADAPELDARLLLEHASGYGMTAQIAAPETPLAAPAAQRFAAALARRAGREPVARILGEKEFWSLPFRLSRDVLAPRPETEILVESVLAWARASGRERLRFADLGCGSGAIAVALLAELPEASGIAVDISPGALETARSNAERHGVAHRLSFKHADFALNLVAPVDAILSNPPYIASAAIAGLPPEVRDHDPRLALDGGPDGMACYRAILGWAPAALPEGGLLGLEIGDGQGAAVVALCENAGLAIRAVRTDLAGRPRVVLAERRDQQC